MARFDDLHEVKGGCVPISFLVLGPIENNVSPEISTGDPGRVPVSASRHMLPFV